MSARPGPTLSGPDAARTAEFEAERPRLLGLAYRITGSPADAEDLVQEAYLRWRRHGPHRVDRPAAWLTTVTSRLALDRLRSAQRTREEYVGPWLPEPVIVADDPSELVELRESLTLGFLVLLERLSPVERVVFLLADVFRVPFDDIAATVDRSPAATRQIASRARRRVRDDRPRFCPTDNDAWQAALAFFAAAEAGDLDGLLDVLSDDVVLVSDGGADHHAARRPVVTPHRVSRLVIAVTRRIRPGTSPVPVWVNGQPGMSLEHRDGSRTVLSLQVESGRITRVWTVVNPAKTAGTEPVALR